MEDLHSLAADLFNSRRAEKSKPKTKLSTVQGVAVEDSADGSVKVRVEGNYTTADGSDVVEIGTVANLKAGDDVIILLEGAGVMRPTAIGAAGWGDRIQAEVVEANLLIAQKASIADLEAATARIGDVEADTAKIHDLTAEELSAATGYVGSLTAGSVSASDIIADHGTVGSLSTNYAHITNGVIDNATIGQADVNGLSAAYAKIDLANIANGTIKTAMIDDGQITSAKILDGTIANADIANGTIESAKIHDAAITTAKIDDLAVTNAKIANLAIDAAKLDNLAVTNAKIADGTIENAKIKDGTIESAKIKDGTIQNADIANGTIENAKIKDGTIETAKIHDGAITNAKIGTAAVKTANIDDAAITSAKILDGTIANADIANGTIENAKIKDGTIETAKIHDAAITTAKIADANVTNAKIATAAVGTANIQNAAITNALIANNAVSNEQVISVSANKLTAGTIDASNINVANLNAKNLVVEKVNGQPVIGGYTVVSTSMTGYSSKNPKTEGWYEFSNGSFVASNDTQVSDSKVYYAAGTGTALYDQAYIDGLESDLNERIDGAIETFTGSAVPTLVNYPASDWTTNALKDQHVGDVYYVINAGNQADGYCYRFAKDSNNAYSWVLIKDSDVTAALQRLLEAEGDIDGLESFQSTTESWITSTDSEISSIKTNHTNLTTVVNKTVKSSVQLWYSKANTTAPGAPTSKVTSTSTSGNDWRVVVPEYSSSYPNYYYCWQYEYADGTYGWSAVVRDIAMGESQAQARKGVADAATAQGTANAAQSTANANIKSSVQLWYTKANSTAPSAPSSHVTSTATTGNAWTTVVPVYSSTYPHYFYCYEYQKGDGTYGWTSVVYDSAMTESQSQARQGVSDAANAQSTADANIKSTVQLWFSKANETAPSAPTAHVTSTATTGNAWTTVVPVYSSSYPYYFYCYEYQKGDGTYSWSSVVNDKATAEMQSVSRTAKATADANIKSNVQLWYTKADASTSPSKPTTQVTTSNANTPNAWNLVVPTYNSSYPHYFYCYQQQKGDGSYQWTDVVYDRATTENQANSRSALTQVATKVETSVFNELSQTVDSNTASITSLSTTMEQKQGRVVNESESGVRVIETEDAAPLPMLTLSPVLGECYQRTTTGKNLAANSIAYTKERSTDGTWSGNTYTHNDVTFACSVNGYGYIDEIIVNGTASDLAVLRMGGFDVVSGTTYTLSGCPSGGSSSAYELMATKGNTAATQGGHQHDYGSGVTFVEDTTTTRGLQVVVRSGQTVSNLSFKPQVEAGSEATDWEMYTNGESPNPDFPQPISCVRGRNLFDTMRQYSTTQVWFYSSEKTYGSYETMLREPGTYYVTVKCTKSVGVYYSMTAFTGGTQTVVASSVKIATGYYTVSKFVVPSCDYCVVRLWVYLSGGVTTNDVRFFRVEKDSPTHQVPVGSIQVRTHGKNLVDTSNPSVTGSYLNGTSSTSNASWNITEFIDVDPGQYTYSSSHYASSNPSLVIYDKFKQILTYFKYSKRASVTFTVPENGRFIRVSYISNDGSTWQVEKGSTATVYEPYVGGTVDIDLQGNELYGLDSTYRDELRVDASGNVTLLKKTHKVQLSSSWTAWKWASVYPGAYADLRDVPDLPKAPGTPTNADSKGLHVLCDKFTYRGSYDSTAGAIGAVCLGGGSGQFNVCFYTGDSSVTSVATWQTWLDANPVSLIYPIEESSWYEIPLGHVDLPVVSDGGTVRVLAEIQPVIGGTWWSKDAKLLGESQVTQSNTTNVISQTATSNSAVISQLTTTLGTNEDGTTKAEDIVHRTSALEQDLSGFHTSVSETYLSQSDAASTYATASQLANTQAAKLRTGGLGMMVNHDTFSTTNNGECYFHGFDVNYAAADVNGWVMWNGAQLTIPKGMWVNPNKVLPYNVTTYIVYRTSDTSFYGVCWDSTNKKWVGTQYGSNGSPGTKADYTWAESTDVVLGSYVESASEAALTNATLYDPPRHFSELSASYESRMTSAETSITQTANSITSLVANNSTYTAPDGTTQTNTIQSAIAQNASDILLRVEKSGVIASINASVEESGGSAVKISADKVNVEGATIFTSGRLSSTSLDAAYDANGAASAAQAAAISAAASDATSKADAAQAAAISAAAADATNKVNAIEIGGRNLLRYNVVALALSGTAIVSSSNYRAMYCSVTAENTYTVSRKIVEGNRFTIASCADQPASGKTVTLLSTNTSLLSVTVTIPSGHNWLFIYLSNQGDTINNGNIKVEKGNKATDWTPAPEDVASDISNAQSAAVSAAASDATSKADAAQSAAIAAAATDATNKVNAIEVGGNLLRNAKTFTASDLSLSRGAVPETGVIRLTPTSSSAAHAKFKVDYLDYEIYGSGMYVFSLEARIANVETTLTGKSVFFYAGVDLSTTVDDILRSATDRYCSLVLYDSSGQTVENTLSSEWTEYHGTFVLPDSLNTGTVDALVDGNYVTVQASAAKNGMPVEVRNPRLTRDLSSYKLSADIPSENGTATVTLYKDGKVCKDAVYIDAKYTANSSTWTAWTSMSGTMTTGVKTGTLNANSGQYMTIRIDAYTSSAKTRLLASYTGTIATGVLVAANSASIEEQLIYISKASGTASVSANTTWVTVSTDSQNTWTTKRPTYDSGYPVLFVATQRKTVGGTVTCTTPLKDDTTTVIDGGHITTGTIDASVATITNINASNISTGTLSADRIAASSLAIGKVSGLQTALDAKATPSDITTAVNAIEVGGRNLLTDSYKVNPAKTTFSSTTATEENHSSYNFGDIYSWATNNTKNVIVSFPALESGSEYTFSFKWARPYAVQTLHVTIGGVDDTLSTVNEQKWHLYKKTFTASSSTVSATIYIGGTSNFTSFLKEFKLEIGNKATDWSPAPEDVDSAVSAAAATATTYITAVDANGVKVHASNNPTTNYSLVNASGLEVFKGGNSVAQFGDASRVGLGTGQNIKFDSDSVDICDGSTVNASFGKTANNDPKIWLKNSGIEIYGRSVDGDGDSHKVNTLALNVVGGSDDTQRGLVSVEAASSANNGDASFLQLWDNHLSVTAGYIDITAYNTNSSNAKINLTAPGGVFVGTDRVITTAGTGLSKSNATLNHSDYGSASTAGTSSATSGSTLDVPYVTTNAQGHVTAMGTHTHTVTGFRPTATVLYNDATGTTGTVTLSQSAANFNHMRVYGHTNQTNANRSSVDLHDPNGKYGTLVTYGFASGTTDQMQLKGFLVSGTSITSENYKRVNFSQNNSMQVAAENGVYIYRVEAWNE